MDTSFNYVYILESIARPETHYVGITGNLGQRLRSHNAKAVRHTAKFVPWAIKAAIALKDRNRALLLEQYLKTHAGRMFAKRHL
jgi:predicted GIY-YIG superfamily endonuclease